MMPCFLLRLLRCATGRLAAGTLLSLLICGQAQSAAVTALLWEVKSATNTVYLFGSVHLAKADFYPLPAATEKAYLQADTVVVELDITDDMASAKAMPLLTFTAPDKLENHLDTVTWAMLKKVAGTSIAQYQAYKPAVVATGLALRAFAQQGYDPAYGIDLHFIRRAKADQKRLVELESMAFQAGVLGGLSDADGSALLQQTLEGLQPGPARGQMQREAEAMIASWKSGDARALASMLRDAANKDAGSKRLMKLLLDDRNVAMTEKITGLLESGSKAFIVVGAGHLAGRNSIVDLLQRQDYQIRQIK
jgi:uncharacterized protein YbaP (TraB family)